MKLAHDRLNKSVSTYKFAKNLVISNGYAHEIEWQKSVNLQTFSEGVFLREISWVILCSGFLEKRIRNVFDHLSLCFCDWESASQIVERQERCYQTAMEVFPNARKINAICSAATTVKKFGFDKVKRDIQDSPVSALMKFDMIGPITKYHLAKNLGAQIAKPDRHLLRLAEHLGFPDPIELCDEVSEIVGEPASVVDVIFWRAAVLENRYFEQLTP
jgi:hypothetical protein